MAQKITQFGQKVAVGVPVLAVKLSSKGAGVVANVRPHAMKFWNNAKVEMAPPMPSEWPAIKYGLEQLKNNALSGKFLDNTMKETTSKLLVATEITFWFFIGEAIGRKSLIGYNV